MRIDGDFAMHDEMVRRKLNILQDEFIKNQIETNNVARWTNRFIAIASGMAGIYYINLILKDDFGICAIYRERLLFLFLIFFGLFLLYSILRSHIKRILQSKKP
jgi:hypothetical protein